MEDLFTERFKFKDIIAEMEKSEQKGMKKSCKGLKELIKEIGKEFKIKADDIVYIRKKNPLKAEDIKIEEGERAAIRYINTADVDRDNEIVMPDGGIINDFQKSMTVLYAHDYWSLPIGRDLWIKLIEGKGWLVKTVYAEHQKAIDIYNLVKDHFLNTSSIGFIPLEYVTPDKKGWDKVKAKCMEVYGIKEKLIDSCQRIYTKWILLEHSDVPIPSNINALNIAVGKGLVVSEDLLKDLREEIKIIENEKEDKLIEDKIALEDDSEEGKEEVSSEEKTKEVEEVKGELLEAKERDIQVIVNIAGIKEVIEIMGENAQLKKRIEELEMAPEEIEIEEEEKPEKTKDEEVNFEFKAEKKKEDEIGLNPEEIKDIIVQAIKGNIKTVEEGLSKKIDDNFKRATGKVM